MRYIAILWSSGMTMVFGPDGEQVPELQGRWPNTIAALLALPDVEYRLGDWALGWMHYVPRDTVAALAVACCFGSQSGLPAVPAVPAGTAAFGDLPDLREISVYLHDVQCAEPGCAETAIAWKATKRVRELLYAIAEHRRRYHHRVAT